MKSEGEFFFYKISNEKNLFLWNIWYSTYVFFPPKEKKCLARPYRKRQEESTATKTTRKDKYILLLVSGGIKAYRVT